MYYMSMCENGPETLKRGSSCWDGEMESSKMGGTLGCRRVSMKVLGGWNYGEYVQVRYNRRAKLLSS